MSHRVLMCCVLSCVWCVAACKGDKGDPGDPGAQGTQGPAGPNPVVATNGGLIGNGTAASPIAVDPRVVPSKLESSRIIEAEASSAGGLGVVQASARASGGSVRFAAASASAGGAVWRVQNAQVGTLA